MGFFKKLKERLFKLDYNSNDVKSKEESQKIEKKNNINNSKEWEDTRQVDLKDYDLDKLELKNDSNFESSKLNLHSKASQKKYEKKLKKIEKLEKKKRLKEKLQNNKLNKYVAGLQKSGSFFTMRLKELQGNYKIINDEYFDELESILVMSDISVSMVNDVIDEVKKEVIKQNIVDINLINEIIVDKIFVIYANQSNIKTTFNIESNRTNIILMTGVNGVGKTTSIAKLTNMYQNEGKRVLIAAADTFRAGAVEQLDVWSKRLKCEIVKPLKPGIDPSSVVYDAVKKIKDSEVFYDILIIDTAGRLQNKVNLMNELSKIKRTIQKEYSDAPHEIALVIDATTGQNGVIQAQQFKELIDITSIILTKMDGTSKGGIILSIKDKLDIPVKYIGLGETIDDLQEFDLDAFIYGLTKELIDNE